MSEHENEGQVEAPPAAADGNQDVTEENPQLLDEPVVREDESDRVTLGEVDEDTPLPSDPVQGQSAETPEESQPVDGGTEGNDKSTERAESGSDES